MPCPSCVLCLDQGRHDLGVAPHVGLVLSRLEEAAGVPGEVIDDRGAHPGRAGDSGVTCALDTELTDELINEGFFRELVSKIQTMRKEADFDVMDRITLSFDGTQKIKSVIEEFDEDLKKEVLATEISEGASDSGYKKDWNINGEAVTLSVTRNG